MHPTLQHVERVEELLQRQSNDTPYDFQRLFRADGFWARRASQKRFRLLKRIDESLRALLWPAERVVFMTSGVLYSFWESYFFGLPMYYLNRRALVLTDMRLILLQIDRRRRPRELRSHILLRAIKSLKRTILGNTGLRLNSGKKFTIAYIPRADRRALVDTFKNAQSSPARETSAEGLEHLCPYCYVPVEGRPLQCPKCNGSYKSAKKAGLLSLLFPGLGDIYLGHLRFAILEVAVALLIWIAVLIPDPEAPATVAERVVLGLFVVAIVHGIDAVSTWHVARKGHYPAHNATGHRPITASTAV